MAACPNVKKVLEALDILDFASLMPDTADIRTTPVSARTLQYIYRELGQVKAAALQADEDAGLSRDEWQGF